MPPWMSQRWIAVAGDAETETRCGSPSHETSTSSRTTGQAQFVITMPFCAVAAAPDDEVAQLDAARRRARS